MDGNKVASDILCEFLEVAIHSVLYTRELYPPGIFSRKKKYNVPVQMSSHPELNKYISDMVKSLEPMLCQNTVQRVDLVIVNTEGITVERFVFEIVQNKDQSSDISSKSLVQLEQTLRAFLLKLNISDSLLTALPQDCTWNIHVHTKESAVLAMQEKEQLQDFTWIPADDAAQQIMDPRMTPLKSSETGLLKMQLYVEESIIKDNR